MKNPIIILINKSFCKAGAGQLNQLILNREKGATYVRPNIDLNSTQIFTQLQ